MRFLHVGLAFLLAAPTTFASAQSATNVAPLTLAEAMRLAETAHPTVGSREAQIYAIEGERREAAAAFFNNPELGLERARRSGGSPEARANEWGIGISQPIEIAGQQARRREAVTSSSDALRAEIEDARRQARAAAALRFYAVLAAKRRVEVEQRSVELFDSTAQAVARRRTAGEDTRLDANVALIEAERARNSLALSREQLLDARAKLATALQLSPAVMPEVTGELDVPVGDTPPYTVDRLLALSASLPLQRGLLSREAAARARVDLERASRYPDVTLGLSVGREGPGFARERITTLSVSVPLPLFKRNDAAIGRALTDATQAEIERTSTMRDSQAQVRRLWGLLESQRQRVQRLQRAMIPASIDNRQLATRSRQAGQIGLLDQLIVNRQTLDAERDLNDALADFYATRVELEQAAGWSQEGPLR